MKMRRELDGTIHVFAPFDLREIFYKLNLDFTFKLNVATKSVENQLVYCGAVK